MSPPPRRLTFAVSSTLLTASLAVGAAGCDSDKTVEPKPGAEAPTQPKVLPAPEETIETPPVAEGEGEGEGGDGDERAINPTPEPVGPEVEPVHTNPGPEPTPAELEPAKVHPEPKPKPEPKRVNSGPTKK